MVLDCMHECMEKIQEPKSREVSSSVCELCGMQNPFVWNELA